MCSKGKFVSREKKKIYEKFRQIDVYRAQNFVSL